MIFPFTCLNKKSANFRHHLHKCVSIIEIVACYVLIKHGMFLLMTLLSSLKNFHSAMGRYVYMKKNKPFILALSLYLRLSIQGSKGIWSEYGEMIFKKILNNGHSAYFWFLKWFSWFYF